MPNPARPTCCYFESGAKIDLGVQRNPLLVSKIHQAIDKYVINGDMSYNQAWQKYRDDDCVASTRVDGEIVHAPWDARRAGIGRLPCSVAVSYTHLTLPTKA
uniref:Uncharacterized protein n=1 Tax=Ralstonia solanacearum TaxID=305 RepID=A0A0S4V7S7_RALSL|nr:protein of unknown function [Ralstonia solanacearum]